LENWLSVRASRIQTITSRGSWTVTNIHSGGEYEFKTTKDIAIKYARDPNSAPIFNYASMAHNNAFFFSTITDDPKPMAPELQKDLEDSFGSIETLKQEFIVTASSMFGPGFVWLVKSRDRKYSLLCTYLAGSPYPGAHYRRQPVDMNTEDKTVAEAIRRTNSWEPVNTVGSHGAQSQKKMAPGGIDLSPILCINMWEHVYLPDYGVGAGGAGGKRAFAESWWHVIDWEVVRKNAEVKPQEAYLT
jgi:Fe-Mn family superoxide dismutase